MSDKNHNDKSMEHLIGKKKILLKILNSILTKSKKSPITKLTDFVNIDRDDLIQNTFDQLFPEEIVNELLKYYKKKDIGWYQRGTANHYIMTFIRYATTAIGYKFEYYKKDVTHIIDNKSYRRTHYIYSIV